MHGKLSRRDLLQVATGVLGAAAGARLGFLGDDVAWAATAPGSLPWLNPLIKDELQARVGPTGRPPGAALPNTGALRRIEGYVQDMSVNTGGTVTVRASSTMGSFVVAFLRMGWYGGDGALEVYRSGTISGVSYPTPGANSDGLIECSWPISVSVPTTGWATGYYLAALIPTSTNVAESYIPFVVRNDASTAQIVMQIPFTTYQAYNTWGGRDFYEGPRANKVSFDRPYIYYGGTQHLFNGDHQVISWLERNDYNVSYIASSDMHAGPPAVGQLMISVHHDEYWSQSMRNNLTSWLATGKSLGMLGANNIYWRVRFEPNSSGRPNRTMACYKILATDPNQTEPTILYKSLNQSEALIEGVEYAGNKEVNFDWVVTNGNHWIYQGTGLTTGSTIPGTVGFEWDHQVAVTPSDTTIIASGPTESIYDGPSNHNAAVRETAAGSVIFAPGTLTYGFWFGGAAPLPSEVPAITKMTKNFFARAGVFPGAVDTTPPTATITSPTSNQILASSPVTITGTASDAGRIASVKVSLYRSLAGGGQYWNGTSWQTAFTVVAATLASPNATTTNWSYVFQAPAGGNFWVAAFAYDVAGNYATVPFRGFSISDTVNPTAVVLSPTANQVLPAKPITISGTATDNAGVYEVQAIVYRPVAGGQFWDGTGWTSTYASVRANLTNSGSTTTTWTYVFNPPQNGGTYYVAAVVVDTSYRSAASPFVAFSLADAVGPAAVITSPANNSATSGLVTISGTATDNNAVNSVGVAIYRYPDATYWNGTAWQSGWVTIPGTLATPNAASTTFSASFTPPAPGYYLVGAVPVDTNNNYSFAGWNVIVAS
jgi:Bacterial Ig domain